MKNKPTWILLAFLVNLALLPLVTGASEGRAQEQRSALLFHCCKKTTSGRPYCCDRCCLFVWNCLNTETCERREQSQEPESLARLNDQ